MNSKKAYYIMLGAIGVLVLILGGSVYLGEKILHQQSSKLMALKLDNQLLDSQQTALLKANKDLLQYAELGTLAKAIVPQDKNQAKTVREILNIGAESNIPLTNISFPSSTLGAIVPKASASATATTPTSLAPPVTQVKPVDGIKGLYRMEIVIQSDPGDPRPYSNLQNFLHLIEQNRRTAQISQIVITPNSKDINLLSFSLTINVFIKP